MMVPRNKCPSRPATRSTQPCSSDLYRCLKRRLWRSLRRSHSKRDLIPTRKQVVYKLPGTKGGLSGPKRVPRPPFKEECAHRNRQHHSCCLHKQRRRHQVGPTVGPDLVLHKSRNRDGPTHSKLAECLVSVFLCGANPCSVSNLMMAISDFCHYAPLSLSTDGH